MWTPPRMTEQNQRRVKRAGDLIAWLAFTLVLGAYQLLVLTLLGLNPSPGQAWMAAVATSGFVRTIAYGVQWLERPR